jgi:hypothetical protein
MTVIQLVFVFLFHTLCGWVGHVAVKVVTFGKVDLDWGDSSESIITETIGAGVLLGIAMIISLIIRHG